MGNKQPIELVSDAVTIAPQCHRDVNYRSVLLDVSNEITKLSRFFAFTLSVP